MATTQAGATERDELLEILAEQRRFLLLTVRGLDDGQAAARPARSELSLGGLVKHVAKTEQGWIDIMLRRPARNDGREAAWGDEFHLVAGEDLEGVRAFYARVAEETEAAVRSLPDLDAAAPLPEAPWFPEGAAWSARRILLHLIRETAQHSGHADILRESLDGATTTEVMMDAIA